LIQVAGIHDTEEAAMLLEEGVHLVGIPLRLTVNSEDLTEAEAAAVSRRFPDKCCLITYLQDPIEIVDLLRDLKLSWLQLHGPVDKAIFPVLRKSIPELRIIKSLIIGKGTEEALLRELQDYSPWVSAFITDTYNPHTKAEGATGMTHDWKVSQRICELADRPVILAGGLNPGNVARSIQEVRPWGVDVHTGVEDASGRKCRKKVRQFVQQAQNAFRDRP